MPVSIRSRLLLLLLSVLLPGLVGAAWLIHSTVQAERTAHERRLRDTARALSMVVDRELTQRATVARVLAQSRWLDQAPELGPEAVAAFERLTRRAMNGMEGWVEVRSADRTVFDSRSGADAVLAAPRTKSEGLAKQPLVLPLRDEALSGPDPKQGEGAHAAHAALVQPVEREGQVVLNLIVTLLPGELQRIVDKQQLPADWVGTVMDDQGIVLARHPGGRAFLGRQATADLRQRMLTAPEGLFKSTMLEGTQSIGYYSTSPQGWSYISAMPTAKFAGLGESAVRQVVLGAAALLALAMAGAWWVAYRIAKPVQALTEAAVRMQSGQPVEALSTGLQECDEVAEALARAAASLERGRTDLQAQLADAVDRTRRAEQRLSQGQRLEALGSLTGGIAHDFNNLLGVVSNSAHLISRHPAAADLQAPLAATLRAVDAGSHLTQHLLRFAGLRAVRPQPLHLTRYMPETLQRVQSLVGARLAVRVQVAPDTAPVRVDPNELELALVNLALNARDAMSTGGELKLAARNASPLDLEDFGGLPASAPPHWVLITVGDNGPGMTPDVMSRAFEPFFTTKPVGKGTGLGMSQVLGFCTQAGGTATVASTPGVGTTVMMILPRLREPQGQDTLASPQAAKAASPEVSVAGARLLLVDDNETLGDVTAALLAAHGAKVQRAASAAEALGTMAEGGQFDAVLSDVVMAGSMDGLALARELRRLRPTLPVVLISGYATAASQSEFPFLHKPCSPQELLAALAAAMAELRQHQPCRARRLL